MGEIDVSDVERAGGDIYGRLAQFNKLRQILTNCANIRFKHEIMP
jgi:hypothetical protein